MSRAPCDGRQLDSRPDDAYARDQGAVDRLAEKYFPLNGVEPKFVRLRLITRRDEQHPSHKRLGHSVRSRLGTLVIGFALVTSGVAGCSATTGAPGAVQDVASAATTTASSAPAASCAEGGVCQIGDAGPGGGIVFYVASAPFTESGSACNTNCSYLESQPSDLSLAAWCTGPGAAPKFVVDAPEYRSAPGTRTPSR